MNNRKRKKLKKANDMYYHAMPYTFQEEMNGYYRWKKFIKKHKELIPESN